MNWPDLLYVLAKQAGMDIIVEDVESMSSEQKRELLCSDPITFLATLSEICIIFERFIKANRGNCGLLLASRISFAR